MMSRVLGLCVAAAFLLPAAVQAQDYPSRPVHIVVPFPPGGPADASARIVAHALQNALGQTFVVENRPGASGTVGTASASKAAPDGYTLLVTNIADTWNHLFDRSLPYDYARDFTPVSLIMASSFMVVGNAQLPARNFAELLELARKKPGELTYGSSGFGVSSHLAGELLAQMTGIDIRHVPYKGQGPAMTDLLGGHISFMFANPVTAMPQISAGKLRALATTGLERIPPGDVPTVAESGVPGFEMVTWFGIAARAGTPKEVIDRLSGALVTALKDPQVRASLEALGAQPVGSTPEEFQKLIDADSVKWEKVISGIQVKQ